MMTTVDYAPEALKAAGRHLSGKGPVQMLNLVRYRNDADYGERTEFEPCSGREAYLERYAPAFAQVAAKVAPSEYAVVLIGGVQATIVAPPGESWDDLVIVEYPSFEVLQNILESPDYEAVAAPHRRAALEDWRFIATVKSGPPG